MFLIWQNKCVKTFKLLVYVFFIFAISLNKKKLQIQIKHALHKIKTGTMSVILNTTKRNFFYETNNLFLISGCERLFELF